MSQQQQAKIESSVGSMIFSILLVVIMVVVVLIQLTIMITFLMTSNRGRCVYTDNKGNCMCKFTNRKSCNSIGGKYNGNLDCTDGFTCLRGDEETTVLAEFP